MARIIQHGGIGNIDVVGGCEGSSPCVYIRVCGAGELCLGIEEVQSLVAKFPGAIHDAMKAAGK